MSSLVIRIGLVMVGCGVLSDGSCETQGLLHRTVTRIQASEETLSWPLFPYGAGSQIWIDEPTTFESAYLTFPYSQFLPMDRTDDYWSTYSSYGHFESLSIGYPEGHYKFGFKSGGSWIMAAYTATGDLPFWETPILTNYLSLQAIDPGRPFRINWSPATEIDDDVRVEVEIMHLREDGIYPTIYRISAIENGSPHPSEGTVEVPAGTLNTGGRYQLVLRFTRATGREQVSVGTGTWNFHTSARAETQVLLGLKEDTQLLPDFSWQTTYDLGWLTSGNWFLDSHPRFPVSKEVHFLFAPHDWMMIPAEQVSVEGPRGTGFEKSVGAYLLADPDETLWYAITSNSINFPQSGNYTVTYRGQTYRVFQEIVPDETSSPLAVPVVTLDTEGKLASVRWSYRNPETGQPIDSSKMAGQTLAVLMSDGSLAHMEGGLAPELREYNIPPHERVPWASVANVSLNVSLISGHRTISRYRITHAERPLHVYFNEGYPEDSWIYIPWLDWVKEVAWPWIWTQRHGFLYVVGRGDGQVMAWFPGKGWIWFSSITYPFAYNYREEGWFELKP